MSTIGNRLRRLREERNITQLEVAEAIGVANSTYSSYEIGAREPNIDTIIKLCKYYDVSADVLIPTVPDPDVQYIEIKTKDIGRELTPQEIEIIETYARFITRPK